MADGLTAQSATLATIPASSKIATDDTGSPGHVQIVKLAIAADGSATVLPGDATDGLLVNLGANNDVRVTDGTDTLLVTGAGSAQVDPRPSVTRIQVSPTTTATAYEALDTVGGLLTFANAARTSGGSIHIESAQIVDEDSVLSAATVELLLFRASVTATDEAAFDPTDAELLDFIGSVDFTAGAAPDGSWHALTDNSVGHRDVGLTATLAATSLYGVLVTRGTPTLASTSSVHVTLTIVQD